MTKHKHKTSAFAGITIGRAIIFSKLPPYNYFIDILEKEIVASITNKGPHSCFVRMTL